MPMPPMAEPSVLELAQAGANEAALAIARLLKISSARVGRVETVADDVLAARQGPRALVVGFTISGGIKGRFAVVTSETHAKTIAHELVAFKGEGLPKKALGALTELGNIGASAYLNGIADMVQASCVPSIPSCAIDDATTAIRSALGPSLIVARVVAGPHELDLALSMP